MGNMFHFGLELCLQESAQSPMLPKHPSSPHLPHGWYVFLVRKGDIHYVPLGRTRADWKFCIKIVFLNGKPNFPSMILYVCVKEKTVYFLQKISFLDTELNVQKQKCYWTKTKAFQLWNGATLTHRSFSPHLPILFYEPGFLARIHLPGYTAAIWLSWHLASPHQDGRLWGTMGDVVIRRAGQ